MKLKLFYIMMLLCMPLCGMAQDSVFVSPWPTDGRTYYFQSKEKTTYLRIPNPEYNVESRQLIEGGKFTILMRLQGSKDVDLDCDRLMSDPVRVETDNNAIQFKLHATQLCVNGTRLRGAISYCPDYDIDLGWAPSTVTLGKNDAVICFSGEVIPGDTTLVAKGGKAIKPCVFLRLATDGNCYEGFVSANYSDSINIDTKDHSLFFSSDSNPCIAEVAVYDRMLTDEELASAMNSTALEVHNAENHTPKFAWFNIIYEILSGMVIVIIIIVTIRKWGYISESRIKHSGAGGSKETAEAYLDKGLEIMADGTTPSFHDIRRASDMIKEVIKNGYADDGVVARVNDLASRINYCLYGTSSRILLPFTLLVVIGGYVIVGEQYDAGGLDTWGQIKALAMTPDMLVYWLAALLLLLTSRDLLCRVVEVQKIPQLTNSWSTKLNDKLETIKTTSLAAGSFIFVVLGFILYFALQTIVIALQIFGSMIYTYTIVLVRTGAVVGRGVGGLGAGLVFGLVYIGIILFLSILALVWGLKISAMVLLPAIALWAAFYILYHVTMLCRTIKK